MSDIPTNVFCIEIITVRNPVAILFSYDDSGDIDDFDSEGYNGWVVANLYCSGKKNNFHEVGVKEQYVIADSKNTIQSYLNWYKRAKYTIVSSPYVNMEDLIRLPLMSGQSDAPFPIFKHGDYYIFPCESSENSLYPRSRYFAMGMIDEP
jgi:hypothetical protein